MEENGNSTITNNNPACYTLGMSISQKRNRILIYRATLREIGSPSYIRLLVSRKEKRVAVQCCEEIDKDSYHVPDYNSWEQFEITCKKLVAMLYKNAGWNPENTYQLFGYPVKRYRLVVFCLEEGKEIKDDISADDSWNPLSEM